MEVLCLRHGYCARKEEKIQCVCCSGRRRITRRKIEVLVAADGRVVEILGTSKAGGRAEDCVVAGRTRRK